MAYLEALRLRSTRCSSFLDVLKHSMRIGIACLVTVCD